MSDYNGFADWTTWNVALWIGNDYGFYQIARTCKDFDEFCAVIKSERTPDGAIWDQADSDQIGEFWSDMRDANAEIDAIETEQDDLDFLDSLEMELP